MGRFFGFSLLFVAVAFSFSCRDGGSFLSDGDTGDGDADGDVDSDIDVDGDGDSDTDSDFDPEEPCTPGDTMLCGVSDIGECQFGQYRCFDHGVWSACEYEINPVPEEDSGCDGLDNNCDGIADEHLIYDNPSHCGECNHICSEEELPHVVNYGCDEGMCVAAVCEDEYFDLNRLPDDGCEYLCSLGSPYDLCGSPSGYTPSDDNCNGEFEEECGIMVAWWDPWGYEGGGSPCFFDNYPLLWGFPDYTYTDTASDDDALSWHGGEQISCASGAFDKWRGGMDLAFRFTGVGEDYFYTPADTSDLNGEIRNVFTWILWVNPEEFRDGSYAIYRRGTGNQLFSISMSLQAGHQKWRICIAEGICGSTDHDVVLNEWTQLAIIHEGSNTDLYVNNVSSGSFVGEHQPGGEIRIGSDGGDHGFYGAIDAIGVFSEVKSPEWLEFHYRLRSYLRHIP